MRNDHFGATDEEVFDSLREDIQFADLALASTTARLATALARAEAAESRLEAFDRQLFEIARVVAPLATNSNLTETVREIVSRLARAEEDIAFLVPRAFKDGEWRGDEERDFGRSANNLVNVAYGAKDAGNRPCDIWDMRACERAYAKLPAHRMTGEVRLLLVACRAALAPREKEEGK